MTMVALLRASIAVANADRARVAATVVACAILVLAIRPLGAQDQGKHYLYSGDMPPGAIGSAQLQRGGPLPGYFQAVEIRAPEGAEIALAADGRFLRSQKAPVLAGMLIAPVYRLKVTRIPLHEGAEVYPTIEVIDRLCPPPGQEKRFPVVVELTQEDLELALKGSFVTRVIYLEDPDTALPVRQVDEQTMYEAGAGEDAIQIADSLGRPMAILRIGGRVPLTNNGELDLRSDAAPVVLFGQGLEDGPASVGFERGAPLPYPDDGASTNDDQRGETRGVAMRPLRRTRW